MHRFTPLCTCVGPHLTPVCICCDAVCQAGFSLRQLREARADAVALRLAGYSAAELRKVGRTASAASSPQSHQGPGQGARAQKQYSRLDVLVKVAGPYRVSTSLLSRRPASFSERCESTPPFSLPCRIACRRGFATVLLSLSVVSPLVWLDMASGGLSPSRAGTGGVRPEGPAAARVHAHRPQGTSRPTTHHMSGMR